MISIEQIPVLKDNYIWVVNYINKLAVVIDPALCDPVINVLKKKNWKLTHILNTHHHNDHIGANIELKKITNCKIIGPKNDLDRIPGIDIAVKNDQKLNFGNEEINVIEVPGHTKGHIAYYFQKSESLFCGDTLFALGCGRVFEGTMQQMWTSLLKLKNLPRSTKVYCAHEYTLANGNFALTVEPGNNKLRERMKKIINKREHGLPTVPSTLGEEIDTNPFLRPDSREIQSNLSLTGASLVDIFAQTRSLKDTFTG